MEKHGKSKNEPGAASTAGASKRLVKDERGAAQGKRYGEALKRLVVEEIEAGRLTVAQAQRRHGIAGSQTIHRWRTRYGKAGGGVRRARALTAAQAEIARLRRDKAELEHALARSTVKAVVLESAMEEAEAVYGEDFKKKFGPGRSSERADGSAGKG